MSVPLACLLVLPSCHSPGTATTLASGMEDEWLVVVCQSVSQTDRQTRCAHPSLACVSACVRAPFGCVCV